MLEGNVGLWESLPSSLWCITWCLSCALFETLSHNKNNAAPSKRKTEMRVSHQPQWRLWGRFLATHPIVVCAVDVSGHAEVSDLHHQALAHQTVAGCQVAVDEVQRRQVDHARGDLGGDVQHLRQRQLTQRGHLRLLQDTSVRTVSSAGDTGGTRDCTSVFIPDCSMKLLLYETDRGGVCEMGETKDF